MTKRGRPIKGGEGRTVALCVRIPPTTAKRLRALARLRNVSQADVIIAAIEAEAKKP